MWMNIGEVYVQKEQEQPHGNVSRVMVIRERH